MPDRTLILVVVTVAVMTAAAAVPSSDDAEPRSVGAAVCGGCHAQERLGRQLQRWTGSMHARTFLVLETGYPEWIDRRAAGLADLGHGQEIRQEAKRLGRETDCTACHAPAVAPSQREPTYHPEDGVQCETCHGPGSRHVATMQQETAKPRTSLPAEARLRRLSLDDCLRCHRHKPSHAVLGRHPFDAARAWKKIAHPLAGE